MSKKSKGVLNLQAEYKFLRKKDVFSQIGGSAGPIKKDNFLHWTACFIGPINTPYQGGLFYIEMKFDDNYPDSRPEVRMRTPTYHPNIDCTNGHICVDYISSWKNTNNVAGIVNVVFDLLSNPNPANGYYSTDEKKAANFTSKYAYESQEYDWDKCWDKGWSNS